VEGCPVMSQRVLVLVYHGVAAGPRPLFIEPELFRSHLDCLDAWGARTVTVSQLAAAIRSAEDLPPRSVALTFDDGFQNVVDVAIPMLAERGFTATVYCVAGHLGGHNDWGTPHEAPRTPLLSASDVADISAAGFEIGSHGMSHARLDRLDQGALEREALQSQAELEAVAGTNVRSLAFPYGIPPTPRGRELVKSTYDAACSTALQAAHAGSDPFALPRVDAHYVRRPGILRQVLDAPLSPYLRVRRAGALARRMVRGDGPVPAS
jgi:peptidoglycan/xylan/chitin deacetylase (PgdA/CDA1 family)